MSKSNAIAPPFRPTHPPTLMTAHAHAPAQLARGMPSGRPKRVRGFGGWHLGLSPLFLVFIWAGVGGENLQAQGVTHAPPGVDGTIQGRVLDDLTGLGIAWATVDVLDSVDRIRARTTTDVDGAFLLTRLQPGPFRIRVSALGYGTIVTPHWRVASGEVLVVAVRVHPSALLLAPLEVIARSRFPSPVLAGFHARLARGIGGVFFSREDIEQRAPVRISDLLAEVPGLRLESAGISGSGSRELTLRFGSALTAGSGGTCEVQIFIDGQPANRRNQRIPLDDLASPSGLEGIEIYRGLSTIPPEFLGPDARCGVVALWTRRGGGLTPPSPEAPALNVPDVNPRGL
jgi:hypothetical protein